MKVVGGKNLMELKERLSPYVQRLKYADVFKGGAPRVDTWPLEQRIGAYRHGALKYLMRMGSKDESPQEIAKGQHYMQKLLEVLNEQK